MYAPSPRGQSALFIGINYAPEPTGIGPYTTGMAEGLARRGWGVDVITGFPHYPWWRIPEEHRTLRERCPSSPGAPLRAEASQFFDPGASRSDIRHAHGDVALGPT
jgi:hypothetical protein